MLAPTQRSGPLRVLMISDVYFPRINGVSTSIETFRSDLAHENIDVQLIAPEYPEPCLDPTIQRVPSSRVPFDPEDRLMHWRPLQQKAAAIVAQGIDLIHVQTPFVAHYTGTRLARRHGIPIVTTYHTHFEEYIANYFPYLPRPLLKMAARRLAKSQCNAMSAVVVPSRAMEDTLQEYGVSAPLHILPTGIPQQHFQPGNGSRFRAAYGIAVDRPVALFVGRVAHEKNIPFLLEAMQSALKLQPDLLLIIAGEGPALSSLKQAVASMQLSENVLFVGYLDRQQALIDCYAAADVFVFASRTETQGLVLLEAMAAGTPVYALAILGTRDILEPQRGAVIAPDDPSAFGKGLAELLHDRTRLAELSDVARDYAQEWSAAERARQLAQLYRSLVPA